MHIFFDQKIKSSFLFCEFVCRQSVYSFCFVRHPFSRFVSAYEEKMEVAAGKKKNHRMNKVRQEVIQMFPQHYAQNRYTRRKNC